MRRWLGIGGVFGSLVAACSGSSLPYPDVQSFCAAKAQAECQVAAQCLASTDACTAARQSQCASDATAATMTGTRAYTPANAQNCLTVVLAAYAPSASGTTAPIPAVAPVGSMAPSLQAIDAACEPVFSGSVPPMGKCTTDFDCAQGAEAGASQICAQVSAGSAKLECATPMNVNIDAPCGGFGSVCPVGAYCEGTAPAICRAGGGPGANCTLTKGCGVGAFCSISKGANTGSCLAGGGPDAPCATSQDCGTQAPFCDTNVAPTSGGATAKGTCVTALFSLGSSSDDCKAFGGM
jgi:hypothetical protein